ALDEHVLSSRQRVQPGVEAIAIRLHVARVRTDLAGNSLNDCDQVLDPVDRLARSLVARRLCERQLIEKIARQPAARDGDRTGEQKDKTRQDPIWRQLSGDR